MREVQCEDEAEFRGALYFWRHKRASRPRSPFSVRAICTVGPYVRLVVCIGLN